MLFTESVGVCRENGCFVMNVPRPKPRSKLPDRTVFKPFELVLWRGITSLRSSTSISERIRLRLMSVKDGTLLSMDSKSRSNSCLVGGQSKLLLVFNPDLMPIINNFVFDCRNIE